MASLPVLYAHPFSSYSQKALIALWENDTAFEYRVLSQDNPSAMRELSALWPLKKFPVLVENGRALLEATIIIEYLELAHPGRVRLLPKDPAAALETRMMDRFFDNYIMTPMQKIVTDKLRAEQDRDEWGVREARAALETAYGHLDGILAARRWAAGEEFGLADCAAAPSLLYADWAHEIRSSYPNVRAYRTRLLQRPAVARAVDEARPFRHYFPLGAPDRD